MNRLKYLIKKIVVAFKKNVLREKLKLFIANKVQQYFVIPLIYFFTITTSFLLLIYLTTFNHFLIIINLYRDKKNKKSKNYKFTDKEIDFVIINLPLSTYSIPNFNLYN